MRFWSSPRQPCVGLALGAATAIACADRWPADQKSLFVFLLASAAASLLRPRAWFFWPFVFAAFFLRQELAGETPGSRLARELGAGSRVVRGRGVVLDEPRSSESIRGLPRSRFTVELESIALDKEQRTEASAWVVWMGNPPRRGDRVAFHGDARNLEPARNPGSFDYPAELRRRGIFSEIHLRYAADGKILAHDCGNPLPGLSQKARGWLQAALTRDLDDAPEVAGLVQSLILGLKDETPAETREMFQRTGTLHLFVVNGLHVGMFGLIAWFLLKPLGVTRRAAVFVIVPLLVLYALVTGLSPGSVRATVMAAIFLGGTLVERTPLPFNSLAAAAFAILLWDPNELFRPGFQFSFGVVFAILLLAGPLRRRLIPLGRPDSFLPRLLWKKAQLARSLAWDRVATLLAVTTAASIGSTPFTATYFNLLSPSAILANLLIVPLALALLFEGVLSMLGSAFSSAISAVFNNVNFLFAHGILSLVHVFSQLPAGHLYVELPRKHAACEIEVFDLGAGGAAHLRSGGCDWLIDCGNEFAYENVVRPFLRARGVNRLDGLILTHGDVAHLGAAGTALADFHPREILDSPLRDRSPHRRGFHAQLAADQLGKSICEPGDVLRISSAAQMRVLYPPAAIEARSSDDKALVLQFEALGTRILFTSDSGFATEQWLLAHHVDLRSDLLVKGRHDSDLSGTPDFLSAVNPRVIVCSAASFPPSQQLDEAWARDVAARGVELFRQDKTGAISIALNADSWSVRAFIGDQVFTSRVR